MLDGTIGAGTMASDYRNGRPIRTEYIRGCRSGFSRDAFGSAFKKPEEHRG